MADKLAARDKQGQPVSIDRAGPSGVDRSLNLQSEIHICHLSFVICHFIRASGENDGLRCNRLSIRNNTRSLFGWITSAGKSLWTFSEQSRWMSSVRRVIEKFI